MDVDSIDVEPIVWDVMDLDPIDMNLIGRGCYGLRKSVMGPDGYGLDRHVIRLI